MSGGLGILSCGVGNLGSVRNILDALSATYRVAETVTEIEDCDALIMPGVGAFDQMAGHFIDPERRRAALDFIESGRPVLAICMGMQVLFQSSEEGSLGGLDLMPAPIRHLGNLGCNDKIPHVGFNTLTVNGDKSGGLADFDGKDFYFVHSYAAPMGDWVNGVDQYITTTYGGVTFVSALRKGRLWATQFHPEKSGELGLELVGAFLKC